MAAVQFGSVSLNSVSIHSGTEAFRLRSVPVQAVPGQNQLNFVIILVQAGSGSDQFPFKPALVRFGSGSLRFGSGGSGSVRGHPEDGCRHFSV